MKSLPLSIYITHHKDVLLKMLIKQTAKDSLYLAVCCDDKHVENYEEYTFSFKWNIVPLSKFHTEFEKLKTAVDFYMRCCVGTRLNYREFIHLIHQLMELSFIDKNNITLFLDANLGSSNAPHISQLFAHLIHAVRDQIGQPINRLYPFTDTGPCCTEAQEYLKGETTETYFLKDGTRCGGLTIEPGVFRYGFAEKPSLLARRIESVVESNVVTRMASPPSSESLGEQEVAAPPRIKKAENSIEHTPGCLDCLCSFFGRRLSSLVPSSTSSSPSNTYRKVYVEDDAPPNKP